VRCFYKFIISVFVSRERKLSYGAIQPLMDRHRQLRNDEDIILMRRVANGDIEAFDHLYRKFYPLLKSSFADCTDNIISSEDLIQEVFTRLWQQRSNFREESSFVTYLRGIARYVYSERLRQYRRLVEANFKKHMDLTTDSYHDLSQPEAEFYRNELTAVLERIQTKLTSEQQQALRISQAMDVSMADESLKHGCSYNAMRCRLKRVRKRFAALLASFLEDE